ncbi:hypothetical protein BDF21DRAFT_423471 [Thamnidium elegans]|nr:hypothetical protein BDF21DRAFT_423471 [Thamnidium elegans]
MASNQFTEEEWQRMSKELQKQLGPEYLAQRPGPSGRPLTYIEGKTAINIANDIFGFNGWSTDIKDTTIDFVDVSEDQKFSVGVSVTIRITLRDGSYHEDMGYGHDQNSKSKGSAFEKARKQAVTDATKRTLRYFGNALGNCLYDNPYLNGIGKMAKPTIKFTAKNLYRHDQFESKQTSPPKIEEPPKPVPNIRPAPPTNSVTRPTVVHPTIVKPEQVPQHVPKAAIKPNVEIKSNSASPVIEYKSATLLEPIVPEDSFTYGKYDSLYKYNK